MRWPDACRLIQRIKAERPELTVDAHASPGASEQYFLRVYCIRKDRQLIPESLDILYSAKKWEEYKQRHPEPWRAPEDSYHANALGQEVDHRGNPVRREPLPAAERVTAGEMLERIIALNRSDRDWRKNPVNVAELAAAWGVRTKGHGVIADYEVEEIARLAPDCHASILIARSGSGLFTYGIAARWGNGGTALEPGVGSVPFDTEFEARRAAFMDLMASLESGRGATRHRQRQLLLNAVKSRDRERGLFD